MPAMRNAGQDADRRSGDADMRHEVVPRGRQRQDIKIASARAAKIPPAVPLVRRHRIDQGLRAAVAVEIRQGVAIADQLFVADERRKSRWKGRLRGNGGRQRDRKHDDDLPERLPQPIARRRSLPSHRIAPASGESVSRSCRPTRFGTSPAPVRSATRAPAPVTTHQDANGWDKAAIRITGRPRPSIPQPPRLGHEQANSAAPVYGRACARRHRPRHRLRSAGPAPAPWRSAAPGDGLSGARLAGSHDAGTPPPIPAAISGARPKAPPPAAHRSSAMSRGIGRPSGAL